MIYTDTYAYIVNVQLRNEIKQVSGWLTQILICIWALASVIVKF